jgi:dTDP-L-rhamnose 4-epimerase
MKILITGGAGFIGSRLAEHFIKEGHEVRILDNLLAQVHGENPQIKFSEGEFVQGDVRDEQIVATSMQGIDVVHHLAAETGVGQSQYEIERYISTNTHGTAVVLQEAVRANVKQVIIASSRAVYGEGLHICDSCDAHFVPQPRGDADLAAGNWEVFCPKCNSVADAELMAEDDPTAPTSIYGLTKLQQEQIASQVERAYSLPVTILRFFNVFGPGQSLGNPYVGVLGTFFRRIVSGEGIEVYEDGKMRRDFVFVEDIVEALCRVTQNEKAFGATLNVGTGIGVTLKEIGKEIFRVLDREPQIKISGRYRIGDVHHAVADVRKIASEIDYVPLTDFKTGLRAYLEWALANDEFDAQMDANAEKQLSDRNLLRQAK